MAMRRVGNAIGRILGVLAIVLVGAPWSSAQQASGIAGIVRDTSGAVLPGVTVEAASPALIEKVRTVVSDGEGRYNITDLRPGTYTVTFTLAGFSTFKRDGIVLQGGFTATVNADLQVGSLEETITVSGAAPLVDAQNTKQLARVSDELLTALPTSSKTVGAIINLTPGLTGAQDVGGSAGTYATQGNNLAAHGKTGNKFSFDGMRIENMEGAGSAGYILNQLLVEETTVETGGVSADSNVSGVAVNAIPKEGSNLFRFGANVLYTNDNFQSNNLDDRLRSRGLTSVNRVLNIYDVGWTLGGPIKKDKIWFFGANRYWGNRNQVGGIYFNKTQGTPFYTPDLSRPSDRYEWYRSYAVRVTYQASAKNKFNVVADTQKACTCRREGFNAPEAQIEWQFYPQGLYQVTWNSPVTSKLLLEAGTSFTISHWPNYLQPGVTKDVIPVTELSTGFFWNGPTSISVANPRDSDRFAQRFAMSYVTGSHAFKTGIQVEEGFRNTGFGFPCCDLLYRLNNGVPSAIEERTFPYLAKDRIKADIGIYAQDQWTYQHLTVNLGLRFDYYNSAVLAQHADASRFAPARDFPAVHDVPSWKDLNPRVGASYDIFGNGRTAVKAALGRYLGVNAVDIANANNPLIASVNTVTRTWTDTNKDFVPDCDLRNPLANGECATISNLNFGKLNPSATVWSDQVLRGFAKRDYLWDFSAEVQHQLTPAISLNGGYYRNWFGNFRVTDNTLIAPTDFSPFCVTAPVDARLPNGGGYQVCGLYDLSPNKFGQSQAVVKPAADFGKQTQGSNFFNVNVTTRFKSGARIGGGVDSGRTVTDSCFTVDSPQQLLNCRVVTPFGPQTQVKLFGSYPLPYDFVVSGVFQNVGGPNILANYNAPNAVVAASLGRNLGSCSRTPCTATVTVPLIKPGTLWEKRKTQLDLRISKAFRLNSGKTRLQANLDVYNALNGNAIQGINATYGAQWLQPSGATSSSPGAILDGRLVELSGSVTF
jgi:hypothetical protein